MILTKQIPTNSITLTQNPLNAQRTSPCTSFHEKRKSRWNEKLCASITVEASLAVPVFFFAILTFFYMFEVMAIRTSIRSGMHYAGKASAEKAYLISVVTPGQLEQDIVEAVGRERLERSIVVGGSSGIHCEGSRMSLKTSILEIKVSYRVELPVPLVVGVSVPMEENMRFKGWSGYERNAFGGENDETVYVTENGVVYHRNYHCTYLDLSIRGVAAESVENLRNESRGKYHACEKCMGGRIPASVYITDYGDRYHSTLACSGLKRTVYAIPLSEAVGKGACSKCGK